MGEALANTLKLTRDVWSCCRYAEGRSQHAVFSHCRGRRVFVRVDCSGDTVKSFAAWTRRGAPDAESNTAAMVSFADCSPWLCLSAAKLLLPSLAAMRRWRLGDNRVAPLSDGASAASGASGTPPAEAEQALQAYDAHNRRFWESVAHCELSASAAASPHAPQCNVLLAARIDADLGPGESSVRVSVLHESVSGRGSVSIPLAGAFPAARVRDAGGAEGLPAGSLVLLQPLLASTLRTTSDSGDDDAGCCLLGPCHFLCRVVSVSAAALPAQGESDAASSGSVAQAKLLQLEVCMSSAPTVRIDVLSCLYRIHALDATCAEAAEAAGQGRPSWMRLWALNRLCGSAGCAQNNQEAWAQCVTALVRGDDREEGGEASHVHQAAVGHFTGRVQRSVQQLAEGKVAGDITEKLDECLALCERVICFALRNSTVVLAELNGADAADDMAAVQRLETERSCCSVHDECLMPVFRSLSGCNFAPSATKSPAFLIGIGTRMVALRSVYVSVVGLAGSAGSAVASASADPFSEQNAAEFHRLLVQQLAEKELLGAWKAQLQRFYLDGILAQDWSSTSSFRRGKSYSFGMQALVLALQQLFHELLGPSSSNSPHCGCSALPVVWAEFVCIALLRTSLCGVVEVYAKLGTSRTRWEQWRRDVLFAIVSFTDLYSTVSHRISATAARIAAPADTEQSAAPLSEATCCKILRMEAACCSSLVGSDLAGRLTPTEGVKGCGLSAGGDPAVALLSSSVKSCAESAGALLQTLNFLVLLRCGTPQVVESLLKASKSSASGEGSALQGYLVLGGTSDASISCASKDDFPHCYMHWSSSAGTGQDNDCFVPSAVKSLLAHGVHCAEVPVGDVTTQWNPGAEAPAAATNAISAPDYFSAYFATSTGVLSHVCAKLPSPPTFATPPPKTDEETGELVKLVHPFMLSMDKLVLPQLRNRYEFIGLRTAKQQQEQQSIASAPPCDFTNSKVYPPISTSEAESAQHLLGVVNDVLNLDVV